MNTTAEQNTRHHIDDVDNLTASERTCLSELEQVIRKHSCEARLGISLLHKHFDIAPDEVMVEFCDEAKREFTIKPLLRAQLPSGAAIETTWRFDQAGLVNARMCVKTFNGHAE